MRPDGLPTIGLAIIAKNEEKSLPRLLDSVGFTADRETDWADHARWEGYGGAWRPEAAVDVVVVCDTGSTDQTVAVAKDRGCHVVTFEWVENFAAARDASFAALPEVDFVLWADCDDEITEAVKLRHIAAQMPPEVAGTIHRYNYAQDEAGNCICELWRERLVRRTACRGWDLPVHEILRVEGALQHAGEVEWVHHTEGRERDPERNYKILQRDYENAEEPSLRTIAYLGTECLALARFDDAIALFREYLQRPDAGWDEEGCQVCHKLSTALRQGENPQIEESEEIALQAIRRRPDWPDGYLDLAEIALRRENWDQALYCTETALRLDRPKTLLITNPLEYNYQPKLMRSVALARLGRIEEAWKETQEVLAMTPFREDIQKQAAGLQAQMAVAEAEGHFLALREILVRHDENEKAAKLMELAPYFIEYRPQIHQAKLDQREMTLHVSDPGVYSRYYGDNPGEAPFEVHGIDTAKAHEHFHRLAFLRAGLKEQGKISEARVLDLSANDGWMAANLSDFGVGRIDCMDLNTDACERARGRAKTHPSIGEVVQADLHTAAEHFEPHSYDAVVCFETIEHVPDVRAMMKVMCSMAKPDGQVYVSTPDGAFEGGNLPRWSVVEQKGHLRAIPASDLAALLCEFGLIEGLDVSQGVVVSAIRPIPRQGRVVFYAGGADARPEQILETGLGGSETAIAKMAEEFARRRYDVRVYGGAGGGTRGDHFSIGKDPVNGQVLYEPMTAWDPGMEADLFVSVRIPEAFDRSIAAPRRALWLHDADYADRVTPERVEKATDVLVLSEFQEQLLTERYPFLEGETWITRNGIEPAFFKRLAKKRKPWVVYSSSPDRGLDILLECWPEIKKRCPKAELHHTYAPVYHHYREHFPHLANFHRRLESLSAGLEGVVAHEPTPQQKLAKLFGKAKVWAYPSWTTPTNQPFPEISCITGVEAQAAGCYPVTIAYGALEENVIAGAKVFAPKPGAPPSQEWRATFIDAVCTALETPDAELAEDMAEAREWAMGRGWGGVADDWIEHFELAVAADWTKITA